MATHELLVDTSIFIDYFRKTNKQKSALYQLKKNHILFISAMTEFEFLVGIKTDHLPAVLPILRLFQTLSFDSACAVSASKIYTGLKRQNQLISSLDILIVATAITHQLPLATLNLKHFERISDLNLYRLEFP